MAFNIKVTMPLVPRASISPIIAAKIIFLPKPAWLGLPAEVKRIIPPTIMASVARGIAIVLIIKANMRYSMSSTCPHWHSMFTPSQGTSPSVLAPASIGANNTNNKQNKLIPRNSFFIFLSRCPRKDSSPQLMVRSHL